MQEENHDGLTASCVIGVCLVAIPIACIIAGALRAAGVMCARGEGIGVFMFAFIVIMCCSHEFFHKNWFGYVALATLLITGMMSVVCTFIFLPLVIACVFYQEP